MQEYIEREAAKERLRMWITYCVLDGDNDAADCVRSCMDLLDSIPAADVVPQPLSSPKRKRSSSNVPILLCARCAGAM